MKNNIVKILVLLLSINCCVPGMLVEAEESEEKIETSVDALLGKELGCFDDQDNVLLKNLGIDGLPQFHSDVSESLLDYQNNKDSVPEGLTDINNEEQSKDSRSLENNGLRQLQIPQKLEVVIDPWEMDGKGQIYSEEYMIRNTGGTPGVLTLSNLACIASEQSGAVVTTNQAGLHDSCEKSIYMQMIFGNGDRVKLSENRSTYQVELQPGEELSICFEGEVNEYASEGWEDGDVAITVVYSWDSKPTVDDSEEKEEIDQDVGSGISSENEEVKEDSGISPDIESGASKAEADEREERIDGAEEEVIQSGKEPKEPKEDEASSPEVIELRDFRSIEFAVDKWEIAEDGKVCSAQYVVRNMGEITGMFTLSDLIYMPSEQSEITAQEKEEMVNASEGMPAYMELVSESGEGIDFSREVLRKDSEKGGYRAILRPGEELKFQFVGEFDDASMDGVRKGDIAVKVVGLWDEEEVLAE